MPITTRRRATATLMLGLAAAIAAFATPGHALPDARKRAACTADVFRLCGGEALRVDDVMACLRKERSNLSPACRAAFDKS
jgi:hypothetical protein